MNNTPANVLIYSQYYQCACCGAYFTQHHECWEDQKLVDESLSTSKNKGELK